MAQTLQWQCGGWFEVFPCGRGCGHEEITGATAAGIVYGTPTHCGRGQVSEGSGQRVLGEESQCIMGVVEG